VRTSTQADLAVRLRHVIARSARRLRQEAAEDLSPSLAAALATIDRHGPLTPSELADRERVKRPTATRIIARLEEAGLVDRARDPHDGRSSLVALAPAGRELLARVRTRKDAYLARRLRELDAEERAALDRAAAILERVLEGDGA
jgi:DNA-binding MarR family transcriptional regulator